MGRQRKPYRKLFGHVGLAVAVFDLAAKDLRKGNGHAKSAAFFLRGPWAAELLGLVGGVLGCEYEQADLWAVVDRAA